MATQTTTSSLPNLSAHSDASQAGAILRRPESVLWAHAAVLIINLPTLLVYFRSLWDQPHYQQFFPIALVAFGYFIFSRLQSFSEIEMNNRLFWPNFWLMLSVVPLVMGTLVFDLNWIFIGLFFVTASLLGRIFDRSTETSLAWAGLILLPVVRPPSQLDIRLITWLQQHTSFRASEILDLWGINHNLDGNTILMLGGKRFFVEEACSGVQSLFTLVFCACLFSAFQKRTFLHVVLLIMAAGFWAAFCNTLRVVGICVADGWGVNLADGFNHTLFGYVCLIFGIAMLYSTERFLSSIPGLGSVDDSEDSPGLTRRLKQLFLGPAKEKKTSQAKTTSKTAIAMTLVVCGFISLVAMIPIYRIGIPRLVQAMVYSPFNIQALDLDIIDETFQTGQFPNEMTWELEAKEIEERDNNSEMGKLSNTWLMRSRSLNETGAQSSCVLSCDYPFLGFHELTGCYRSSGWKLTERKIVEDYDQPFVEAKFKKADGQLAVLLFSLFDNNGESFEIPEYDIVTLNFFQRAVTSFNRRFTRDYGPMPQTYQVQIFMPLNFELSFQQTKLLREAFVEARRKLADAIKNRTLDVSKE